MQELGIKWHLETRKLSKLKEYDKNARSMSKDEMAQIKMSLLEYGFIDKLCVNCCGTIIGGHQRKRVLKELGYSEVECWVPDRELTDDEVAKLNVRLNRSHASWDYDALSAYWDADDLIGLGFTAGELGIGDTEPEPDKVKQAKLTITCDDESKLQALADSLEADGWKVKLRA